MVEGEGTRCISSLLSVKTLPDIPISFTPITPSFLPRVPVLRSPKQREIGTEASASTPRSSGHHNTPTAPPLISYHQGTVNSPRLSNSSGSASTSTFIMKPLTHISKMSFTAQLLTHEKQLQLCFLGMRNISFPPKVPIFIFIPSPNSTLVC